MTTNISLYDKLCQLEDGDRAQVLALLKSELARTNKAVQDVFESGKLSSIETAAAISNLHDNILRGIFKFAEQRIFLQTEKHESSQMSVCAVGGYGRGEMAPFSDLDLLFLYGGKELSTREKNITEYVLYMLWDLRLKVGHASRSPGQCIELGRKDETVLTAMLDLRLLAGAPEPATALVSLLRKERSRGKGRRFIAAKLAARDARHTREGNSRYVIEPNIKEGKGGLRDLHELYWIARFVYGGKKTATHAPVKPHGVSAYVKLGLLDKDAEKRFTGAAEFLWKARHHLHYLAGRATEILSFDRQAALAERMGFSEGQQETRVEAFMHSYFMTCREVGALTRIACTKLEGQSELLLPQGLYRFLPTTRRGLKEPGFMLDHGRLNFTTVGVPKKDPLSILHLFRIAGERNLDIHPNAFASLRKNITMIDGHFRESKGAATVFLGILMDCETPGAILLKMNEAGVLGAYLPEFGAIVARTQFNMHHAYTVDDHTISLIRFLHDIEIGEFTREHPLVSTFINRWSPRIRRCVYLACLFHDVGKSEGDQCEDGARMAQAATRRLGLPETDIDTISWLVRNHLEMSEIAQRRDISDTATVETFALKVGSITRLQMLVALTVVDIRAVGPGIWNDWKGELLRQLYTTTSQCLMGENAADTKGVSEINALFNQLPATAQKSTHYVYTKLDSPKDITELWILTRDRKNLFADLTKAIAACGASVIGARLQTDDNGLVINIFYLQNTESLAFGRQNNARLQDLEAVTLKAARGEKQNLKLPQGLPSKRADAIPVRPRVSILATNDNATIIEVEGRDRVGLLYALAQVLSAHDLSVTSAHIENAGPRAIDVFYVDHEIDVQINVADLEQDLLSVLGAQKQVAA